MTQPKTHLLTVVAAFTIPLLLIACDTENSSSDDEDGLFHLIYEDWSPLNAHAKSWDSPLPGHTSSEDGVSGFEYSEHIAPIDHRTNPTGVFGSYDHPHVDNDATYEIHEPAQDA